MSHATIMEQQALALSKLGTVLIADTSTVGRALVARLLTPYAHRTIETGSATEARERLSLPDLSLVIVDLSADWSFSFLEDISRLEVKPAVLVLTSHPNLEDETRAVMLGAIGYLPKPISLRKILRTLRGAEAPFEFAPQRAYAKPLARAVVIDPSTKAAQITWDVWDMSIGGALIGCQNSLPIGTRLQLLLVLDEEEVLVDAEVVRRQEPTWALVPGAGVTFHYPSESGRLSVERFISDRLVRQRGSFEEGL
jgi:CheY-like chemotaxis protein